MKSGVNAKTRVGQIAYTNCLPFYHQLDKAEPDMEYFKACPAEINAAMRQKRVDIAPVSSLEYLNHQKNYVLLPDCVVAARDFSGSVLLFSRVKIEELNGKTIAVTQESLSSAALLKILLRFERKFENRFDVMPSDPAAMLAKHEAALVIGDDALFYRPQDFVYKYDLSELWWNWTAKPFCFAVWAVRREFAEECGDEVRLFRKRLKRNLEKNLADLETLLKESQGLTFLDEKFPKLFGYLFNLHYSFDPDIREGLDLFYRLAHRLQVSPRPKPLEFFQA